MLTSDNINLGSGELFCKPFDRETSPVLTSVVDIMKLAVEENRLSHVKNGATLSYAATYYQAIDDMEMVSKTIATEENITFKSGLMTWVPETLEKLAATAHAVDIPDEKATGLQLGGAQNFTDRKYHFLFKHQDGKHFVYFIGTSQTSFDIAFQKAQETVIDAEFACEPEQTNADGKKFRVFYFTYDGAPIPAAPTGLGSTPATDESTSDGTITGVTTDMEYKAVAGSDYTACTGTTITALAAGKYLVRVAATTDAPAGFDAEVEVALA